MRYRSSNLLPGGSRGEEEHMTTTASTSTTGTRLAELWVWAEYYCPWCYVTAVRLSRALPEFAGRLKLAIRPFPLEVYGGGPPPRAELELEWPLAALQEPAAAFAPFTFSSQDWPTTTLPAFEAVWCAQRQEPELALEYDLRIRRAFFAESRDIGRPEVLLELAREVGFAMRPFIRDFESGQAREAVLAEGRLGREHYGVRGTPTLMLPDGTRLRPLLAYPNIRDGRIVAVQPLPCCGDGCQEATRSLIARAVAWQAPIPGDEEKR